MQEIWVISWLGTKISHATEQLSLYMGTSWACDTTPEPVHQKNAAWYDDNPTYPNSRSDAAKKSNKQEAESFHLEKLPERKWGDWSDTLKEENLNQRQCQDEWEKGELIRVDVYTITQWSIR